MRKALLIAAGLAGCVATSPAAAVVTMNFENIGTYAGNSGIAVANFYNGGAASNGATGPSLGVTFASNAWTLCLNTTGPTTSCSNASRGGVGDPASAFTGLYFASGTQTSLSDAAGFTSGISFVYAAPIDPGTVQIFSGTDGTGTLLASLNLTNSTTGCGSPYNADFCPFSPVTLTFVGTARSVVFGGTAGQLVLDDISLGISPLPEPGTWAMMLIGFGAIGASLRIRRRRLLAA